MLHCCSDIQTRLIGALVNTRVRKVDSYDIQLRRIRQRSFRDRRNGAIARCILRSTDTGKDEENTWNRLQKCSKQTR